MTSPYQTIGSPSGRLQAAVPTRLPARDPQSSAGLLLRGVVVATYETDHPDHPHLEYASTTPAIYCDVLCYSSLPGHRNLFIPAVLVSQNRSGIHDGSVWKPRAAKQDLSGLPYPGPGTIPHNLDGDHVLVGFLDWAWNEPVILKALPHPRRDQGNNYDEPGGRLQLKQIDGDPCFERHHGAIVGITDNGDFLVDLTKASSGEINGDGNQAGPPEDGSAGNYKVKLQKGGVVEVTKDGDPVLLTKDSGGAAVLEVGNAAEAAIIASAWEMFWNQFANTAFNPHVHPTAVGPSGPPTPLAQTYPANATSSKLLFPGG